MGVFTTRHILDESHLARGVFWMRRVLNDTYFGSGIFCTRLILDEAYLDKAYIERIQVMYIYLGE